MTTLPNSMPVPYLPSLDRLTHLIEATEWDAQPSNDDSWQDVFLEMITLLDHLLGQAEQWGQRIDFYEGVGVAGRIQDITSLVSWMRACIPFQIDQQFRSRLNRYADAGYGYFANGSFFTCDYDGEVAFFIDDQRIYLHRHIQRALEQFPKNTPVP